MSSRTTAANSNPLDPSLDLTGRTIAGFHVLRKIGQGGMGQVYLAEQKSLKRKVALKILRPDLAANPQALARFKLEAEAVAKASHANIVQVHEFGEADGLSYMALEYVEGRNLKEYVARKGPPDVLVALSLMRQAAAALQRASELGIVHRDIKPENILLTRKGEVKVADFGLSRCLEGDQPKLNLTQTGVTMGTPLYMSPEQIEGKPVDARTDIYSLGITCYHLLTGKPPFNGATAFEVALAHVQRPPVPLSTVRPDLPEGLCAIVHKMMAKDPAGRYQTGKDLLRDIVRLREGLSGTTQAMISVEPLSTSMPIIADVKPTRPAPPRDRRVWRVAGVVGSLVLAVGVGVLLAKWERSRQGPLPGAEPPADATVVETILLPHKREQALRLLVDQALHAPAGKAPDASSFTHCMELGLYYLDNGRNADADALFVRLMKLKEPAALVMLGQTGHAVVLALESKPKESNDLLCKVFALYPTMLGPAKEKKGKNPPGGIPGYKALETHLSAIKPWLDHPRGKHWLAKARWYNASNGVATSAVPRFLLWRFPLESDAKK